jgi:hypothetical protein
MIDHSISPKAKDIIFQDAIQRDLTTARRAALLEILWDERYLTRDQLVARVEIRLGKNCFGNSAWEDNFYRDMRIVKKAFQAAGEQILYCRNKQRPGYYLKGQPALSPELRRMLLGSVAEVEPRQIELYQALSMSERVRQGCSISNTARRVVAYRILTENPGIDPLEANRLAIQRGYSG